MDAALTNSIDIEGPCGGGGAPIQVRRTKAWKETTWGEGPSCFYCHVQIASKYNNILPEFNDHERAGIEVTWDKEFTRNSRLACKIYLDERHDGMIVYVPDAPVTDCIWFHYHNLNHNWSPSNDRMWIYFTSFFDLCRLCNRGAHSTYDGITDLHRYWYSWSVK